MFLNFSLPVLTTLFVFIPWLENGLARHALLQATLFLYLQSFSKDCKFKKRKGYMFGVSRGVMAIKFFFSCCCCVRFMLAQK
eukprot:m.29083 g.29083  ORF g.29083 m.29083 type:complete len:82 (+) comp10502_c0_seq1:1547-1792(+)